MRRLERLAKQAGATPARVLKAVLRDGFDYTEWFVRRVKEGDADLKAGRVFSTTDLLTRSRANLRRLRAAHAEIEESLHRKAAARGFLDNAGRVAAAGVPALSDDEIQAEIEAVRRVRKRPRRGGR